VEEWQWRDKRNELVKNIKEMQSPTDLQFSPMQCSMIVINHTNYLAKTKKTHLSTMRQRMLEARLRW
jgi:hypothetical protein